MHLLCSVTPQAHTFILSLLSVSFFLSPRSPRPSSVCLVSLFFCPSVFLSLSCQTYMLISLKRIISVTQDLTFTSLVSFLLSLLSVFLLLDFWLLLLHHSSCILHLLPGCAHCVRNQQQTEVGVWRASSLGLRLHVFGISLPLSASCSPLSLPASCHFALSVRVGMIVLVCSYREWVPYYLWTAALNIITHYASEVAYLQISLCLSQLIVLLLLLLHWIPSLHTLLYWHLFCSTPLLSSLWMSVRFLCMLCPFEFLPETWPCCRILKEPP